MTLRFLGAARCVTGSSFLIESETSRVLVDCGLVQGASELVERNYQAFEFDPARLDAVILTHAHLDHSGLIPRLIADGFRGRLLTTTITKELAGVVWDDFVRLQASKFTRAAHEPPLYTDRDVERTLIQCEGFRYGSDIRLNESCRIRFLDGGHILGSAIVEIWIEGKKLVFSGDLGHRGKPIVRDPTTVAEADVLVLESTYGDRNHKGMAATVAELGAVIHRTLSQEGTVLMPVYAIGRSQDVLYVINQLTLDGILDKPRVYLDSPMAIRAADVYARHLDAFDDESRRMIQQPPKNPRAAHVAFADSAAASRAIAHVPHAVILAGSGMCEGGRIQDHLGRHLDDPRSAVIFTGFQVEGTLGRRLVDGTSSVTIHGHSVPVRASIHTINGLSAHADQTGLLDWVATFKDPKPRTFLVHGEVPKMRMLSDALQKRFALTPEMPAWKETVILA